MLIIQRGDRATGGCLLGGEVLVGGGVTGAGTAAGACDAGPVPAAARTFTRPARSAIVCCSAPNAEALAMPITSTYIPPVSMKVITKPRRLPLTSVPSADTRIAGLPLTIKPYNSMFGTYGSDLRDDAMILETLTLLGQQQKAAGELRLVASRLSQDDWYSTQTTAYSLIAIAQYCGQNKTAAKLIFNYQWGSAKSNVNSSSYLWQSDIAANGGSVTLKNNGNNKLYIRLIQQGQPSSGQDVQSVINPDVLEMRIGYFTLGGKEIDPSKLTQGTDFVAQVNIKNPGKRGRYDNMALTQIFPSGWEILNTRMMGTDEAFKSSESDYRDIRDDRVNTYFSLPEGKAVTYYVMLNAAYAGNYYLPAAYCEAMYNNSITALLKGEWVEVVK